MGQISQTQWADDEPVAKMQVAIFDADEESERVVFRFDGDPRTIVRQVMRSFNENPVLRTAWNALLMEEITNNHINN